MLIRKATLDDIPAIAQVHVDSYLATYKGIIPDRSLANQSYIKRQSSWEKIFSRASNSNEFAYVAENKTKQIIGFVHGGLEREGNLIYKGEIYAIYVLPNYQQQGIGRNLWQAAIEKLNRMGINSLLVWVLADNSAYRFYEALKGVEISTKQIKRDEKALAAIAYGWLSTANMIDG